MAHTYPPCEGRESEMIETVERIGGCKARVAHDGMEIEI